MEIDFDEALDIAVKNSRNVLKMKDLPLYLDQQQAAKLLGVTTTTLAAWRCKRRKKKDPPPFVKFGREPKYRTSDLMRWMAQRTYIYTGVKA